MEKEKIWEKIRQSDTSKLVPDLNETELIQQLVCRPSPPSHSTITDAFPVQVLQHLQHDGYVETARAFAEEIVAEKTRLHLDPKEQVATINVRDDEDARRRQRKPNTTISFCVAGYLTICRDTQGRPRGQHRPGAQVHQHILPQRTQVQQRSILPAALPQVHRDDPQRRRGEPQARQGPPSRRPRASKQANPAIPGR